MSCPIVPSVGGLSRCVIAKFHRQRKGQGSIQTWCHQGSDDPTHGENSVETFFIFLLMNITQLNQLKTNTTTNRMYLLTELLCNLIQTFTPIRALFVVSCVERVEQKLSILCVLQASNIRVLFTNTYEGILSGGRIYENTDRMFEYISNGTSRNQKNVRLKCNQS